MWGVGLSGAARELSIALDPGNMLRVIHQAILVELDDGEGQF